MKNEIFSNCCCFGDGVEEVHVLKSDFPINRKIGERDYKSLDGEQQIQEATCIYTPWVGFGVHACEHYHGTKKVQRNKRKVYKVFCDLVGEKK